MHNNAESNQTARSLAAIAAEMKQELKEFAETRIAMLKSEFREKIGHWKIAVPLAGIGVVLLATAYLLSSGGETFTQADPRGAISPKSGDQNADCRGKDQFHGYCDRNRGCHRRWLDHASNRLPGSGRHALHHPGSDWRSYGSHMALSPDLRTKSGQRCCTN